MTTKLKQTKINVRGAEDFGMKNVYDCAINSQGDKVYVGQRLTNEMFSDRVPYTVVGVSKSGAKLIVQRDSADFTDFDPFDGYAEPKRDETGMLKVVNMSTKYRELYREAGNTTRFTLNDWDYYRDPSF